jgi:Xaa-Pro aminopeptidase
VPEEHIYLRYEDVIVITENGYENFTHFLPGALDDIEKLVGQGGIIQSYPALDERPAVRNDGDRSGKQVLLIEPRGPLK